MPEKPEEKLKMPDRNARPDGFWSIPDGLEGISGSVDGVNKAIDALENVPAHHKAAIKEEIAALLAGTEFNYVKVLARAALNDAPDKRHCIGHFDITVSKKNL